MAIGGGGLSALFWVPPVTSGDLTAWLSPGVLEDSGTPIGGGGSGRTALTTNTDFFISHDTGNDANNGSVGSPWATLQHAVNVIANTLDIAGFTITLHIADSASTYAGAAWTTFFGGGQIVFLGNNTTLGNVKVGNSTNPLGFPVGSFFSGGGNTGTLIWVSGVDMHPTTGACFDSDGADRGVIVLGEPTFLLSSKNKYSSCQANSYVIIGNVFDNTTDVSVIDGTALAAQTPRGFIFQINTGPQRTSLFLPDFTVTGAVTFSRAFAIAGADGLQLSGSIGGAGNVTGKKFEVTPGGVLIVDSLTSLPGTLAGTNDGFVQAGASDYVGTNFLQLNGTTSGLVTVQPQAVAGTWTFQLPTNAGTNTYALTTDGTGITTWTAPGAATMAIGSAVTAGTPGSILFVGAGPVLAQDNTDFFWDDANKFLEIGHAGGTNAAYFVNGARAIYVIPNVTANNWFEGAAGNTTVSGYGNFGTGDSALVALTTGFQNVAIGANAGLHLLDGSENFAMGSNSLRQSQSDSNNIAIGNNALFSLGNAGTGGGNNTSNISIGFGALNQVETAFNNTVLGNDALSNIVAPTTASANSIIGSFAGNSLGGAGGGNVINNTLIGANAASNLTGTASNNVWIGSYKGPVASVNESIAISDGLANTGCLLDFGLTTFALTNGYSAWSMSYSFHWAQGSALHIYNFQDAIGPAQTNWERAVLDWNITANIFTIGTQAGGTGTIRNMKFIIGGTNKLDFGVTNAGLWTFAQATMFATSVALTNGAAAQIGTLTNGPAAGNPTKWIPINDNGTTRYIPAW